MKNIRVLSIISPKNIKKMKNIIIKYGLISGVIAGILLSSTTMIFKNIGFDKIGFENSMYMGYATMIASMSVIFFGIKAFRDQHNEGTITFLKALLIGLGITLISCIVYALVWLVVYYNFIPTFMDDYANVCIQKAKNAGVSQAEMSETIASMNQMKEWYKNPFMIFAMTLTEPLPVGILVSLVSAVFLRKK
jgi:Protein of unknown function (DUF4199)